MRRFLVLVTLVLGSLLAPSRAVTAQEQGGTPSVDTAPVVIPVASPALTQPLAEFVREISLGTASSSAAAGVAVGTHGTLYVIDSLQDHILVFDRDGNLAATWGETGEAPGQFRFNGEGGYWGDLALGPDGNLYVADPFNARIQVLSPEGDVLRTWSEPPSATDEVGRPTGIAVDHAGRVYVTADRTYQLQIFASDGTLLATWEPSRAEGGPFRSPADVAVDTAGNVTVTDSDTGRVYRFDAAGHVIAVIGSTGYGPDRLASPRGVAVDPAGNVYVAEYAGSRVQVFLPDGTHLASLGTTGSAPGELRDPFYVTIGDDGLLFVAQEGSHRVDVFRLLPPLAQKLGTPIPE